MVALTFFGASVTEQEWVEFLATGVPQSVSVTRIPAALSRALAIDLGRAVLDSRGHLQFFYFEEVIFGKWFHVVVKPNVVCSGLWVSSFHITKPSEVARHTKSGKVLRAYK